MVRVRNYDVVRVRLKVMLGVGVRKCYFGGPPTEEASWPLSRGNNNNPFSALSLVCPPLIRKD